MVLNCTSCGYGVPTVGLACPRCGASVRAGARSASAGTSPAAPSTVMLGVLPKHVSAAPATVAVGAMFGVIVVRTGATIYLPVPVRTYMVGRADARNGVFPDIDLTPFGAGTGVSRQHARLHACGPDGLNLEVVSASAMTYINQRPCVSYEVVALHHGDDLLLGDFALRIAIL